MTAVRFNTVGPDGGGRREAMQPADNPTPTARFVPSGSFASKENSYTLIRKRL